MPEEHKEEEQKEIEIGDNQQPNVIPNKKEIKDLLIEIKQFKLIALAAIFIACGSLVFSYLTKPPNLAITIDEMNTRLEKAENDLKSNYNEIIRLWVDVFTIKGDIKPSLDFSIDTLQNLERPFAVSKLLLIPHLAGVKIRGHIINKSSVTYQDAKFKFTIYKHLDDKYQVDQEEKEKEFWIKEIGPGKGVDFGLFIDEIDPKKCKTGMMDFIEGTVMWRK